MRLTKPVFLLLAVSACAAPPRTSVPLADSGPNPPTPRITPAPPHERMLVPVPPLNPNQRFLKMPLPKHWYDDGTI